MFCFYDIDHDHDLDLFYSSSHGGSQPWEKNLRFYRNQGTPQNANIVLEVDDMFPELMIHQAAPYLIDIDLDGDGDLFVGDTWGGIRFFRNQEFSSVADNPKIQPYTFTLHPNYPNPFNAQTVIPFTLDFSGRVSINIYNINGQSVGVQYIEPLQTGMHEFVWNAEGMASGVYLVRLRVDGKPSPSSIPMILLK